MGPCSSKDKKSRCNQNKLKFLNKKDEIKKIIFIFKKNNLNLNK